ncbi:chromophore lyase CpcT/CpeT [Neolewinella lacunae]|uniref:Chromophore lyase CpcT/CpeT n=1 Tax=Neolewinella lacunae TaxID=1517758 RepID=A0A923TE54_9BACT|nr:chromophore lyase CpcT/CpeT [Neolewinella lacunae]MBC6995547.1 chromophore lyase CpcT/CpeT [Neolewinella lacunae]MDN3635583.1 chromophore lyase CpcT/CpeT [Neolewinella lacunae]
MPYRFLPFVALLFVACSSTRNPAPAAAPDAALLDLKSAMTGSYNSSAQAGADPAYYDIRLHMQEIWPERPEHYLYVEQAVADAQDKPYRQRVYRLERKGKQFISHVYELPDPERFIGAHRRPALLNAIGPADLIERKGCAVYLKIDKGGVYRGSTRKKDCPSSLRGAAYATSRVSVTSSFIQSWDQGFDAQDQQVWGATGGGYMFFKE